MSRTNPTDQPTNHNPLTTSRPRRRPADARQLALPKVGAHHLARQPGIPRCVLWVNLFIGAKIKTHTSFSYFVVKKRRRSPTLTHLKFESNQPAGLLFPCATLTLTIIKYTGFLLPFEYDDIYQNLDRVLTEDVDLTLRMVRPPGVGMWMCGWVSGCGCGCGCMWQCLCISNAWRVVSVFVIVVPTFHEPTPTTQSMHAPPSIHLSICPSFH